MRRFVDGPPARTLAILGLALALTPSLASGADRICAQTGAETITYPAVVEGNLVVVEPAGGSGECRLVGVEVRGNVLVRDGGILVTGSCRAANTDPDCPNPGPAVPTRIAGHVISDGAPRAIRLFGRTDVAGNVLLKNTTGIGAFVSLICGVDIHGHLQVKENEVGVGIGGFGAAPPSGGCGAAGPTVGKHVLVSDNLAQVDISQTTVMGQLHCVNNVPAPTDFGDNIVLGQTKGQCSGFAP
jgi:hypothetical protein